jgi:Tfx family DNA-binding protein
MVNIEETHLTQRQFEVLRSRIEGKSLTEIARGLKTSRSNVSRVAKIAERNIERAKNTLKLIGTIEWPIKIDVTEGSNVYSASEEVFRKADEKGVRITRNYAELVRLITETLGRENLKGRNALRDFSIMVSKEGKVEVL